MLVELVANFKYLGRPMDQTNNEWPALRAHGDLENTSFIFTGIKGGDYTGYTGTTAMIQPLWDSYSSGLADETQMDVKIR